MSPKDALLGLGLPGLSCRSIWLVGGDNGDPPNLSPLALQALGTADAVIHDHGVSRTILDLVKPPRYLEATQFRRGIERSIKLAQDGWRVVHLVEGNAAERATESAVLYSERNISLCVVPGAGDPIVGDLPIGFFLVRRSISLRRAGSSASLVLLVATPQSETTSGSGQRQRPLDFSMSGLAG